MHDPAPERPAGIAGPSDALAPSATMVGGGSPSVELEPELLGSELAPDAEFETARRGLGFGFWLSVGWLTVIVLLAVLADILPLEDPNATFVGAPGLGPGLHHLLGTDELGRDLLSRVIFGSRVSLIVGFTSIAVGMLIGGSIGLAAGYFRGKIDAIVTGLANILLAFPALVLALAIVTFMGPSLFHVTLAISILAIGPLTLLVRGSTIVFSQREFVVAARLLGAKSWRVVYREILANVLPGAMSLGLIAVAVAIVAEGALSFLGVSVRTPTASWGNMIAEGRIVMVQHPLITLWPAALMFLTVLALNFAGDRLRAYFDVREGAL
ncbi:MAG TPA: ABC transporter permease [Acidimicrobiales bacterium]|nr:ABC transporter permease [Acidimicrobiales bacterium]